MKVNPLFSDSTKVWTDTVPMKVELEALFLYEQEEVYFKCQITGVGEKKVPLTYNGEGLFIGEINLCHQKEFTYCFVVERAGRELLKSPEKTAKTSYFLSDNWQPKNRSYFPPVHMVQTVDTSPEALGDIIDRWGL